MNEDKWDKIVLAVLIVTAIAAVYGVVVLIKSYNAVP